MGEWIPPVFRPFLAWRQSPLLFPNPSIISHRRWSLTTKWSPMPTSKAAPSWAPPEVLPLPVFFLFFSKSAVPFFAFFSLVNFLLENASSSKIPHFGLDSSLCPSRSSIFFALVFLKKNHQKCESWMSFSNFFVLWPLQVRIIEPAFFLSRSSRAYVALPPCVGVCGCVCVCGCVRARAGSYLWRLKNRLKGLSCFILASRTRSSQTICALFFCLFFFPFGPRQGCCGPSRFYPVSIVATAFVALKLFLFFLCLARLFKNKVKGKGVVKSEEVPLPVEGVQLDSSFFQPQTPPLQLLIPVHWRTAGW